MARSILAFVPLSLLVACSFSLSAPKIGVDAKTDGSGTSAENGSPPPKKPGLTKEEATTSDETGGGEEAPVDAPVDDAPVDDVPVDDAPVADDDDPPARDDRPEKPKKALGEECRRRDECVAGAGIKCTRPRGAPSKVKTTCMDCGKTSSNCAG